MRRTSTIDTWAIDPKPNTQANLRLFCFPYAGGAARIFRTWGDSLPKTVEVCPMELPGRGKQIRLAPFTRLQPLVEALAQALLPHLDKPFAFFGHSMGGLICFELTRHLRQQYGLNPVHLFISGRRAPHLPARHSPIHGLPDSKFLDRLRRLNGTPQAVLENAELMELLLPILRSDFEVLETYIYIPESPLNCPISAFCGSDDSEAHPDEVGEWQMQTRTSFSLYTLPGDHFFLHSAEPLLLQIIAQKLLHHIPRIVHR
ncbi:thioesterase II family protein [Coleofasciculus chthonoplastes]|uniref:thioesterase II family protein n=1 Tax=Coleofasciculus chthonoplastes TaxID=64178 RepID=UPI0032F640C3